MRDSILLYLNGQRLELRGSDVLLPLSRFLRERRGLTGLKVVCGEGACGACTVLVGDPISGGGHDPARLTYSAVNSCLHPVFQMHGRHVVTVEGLQTTDGSLSAIQAAMVKKHGSQCGYCTPGVVVSLTGLFDKHASSACPPGAAEFQEALSGNLCRCTGYLPILESAESVDTADYHLLAELYPSEMMCDELAGRRESVTISLDDSGDGQPSLLIAETLDLAIAYRAAKPGCRVVAGGTGFAGAEHLTASHTPILSLGRIPELSQVVFGEPSLILLPQVYNAVDLLSQAEERIFIGALVTWSELGDAVGEHFPELAAYLRLFGSPQIRYTGTFGGSVAQAEGNADILPLLLVQEATVHLASLAGEQAVPIADFLAEKCGLTELLTGVSLPVPAADEALRLFKVRRRQAFDRSVFCAAMTTRRADDGSLKSARIACGGIGPAPMRLLATEAFLVGASFTEETMRAAGAIAAAEISPVNDAYGSAEYRRQLVANLPLRYFWNVAESEARP